jgi:5-methylcytosine-specific restriction endonuclease McrA
VGVQPSLFAIERRCTRCQLVKDLSAFSPNRSATLGVQGRCKSCCAAIAREPRNAEANRERTRRSREEHPERWRAYQRADYWRDPAFAIMRQRGYQIKHAARVATRKRLYREANAWRHLRDEQTRRARMSRNGGTYTLRDIQRLMIRFRGLCAYCGIAPANTLDHVQPISHGGRNSIGNLLPACQHCNFSKGSKFLFAWLNAKRKRALAAHRYDPFLPDHPARL